MRISFPRIRHARPTPARPQSGRRKVVVATALGTTIFASIHAIPAQAQSARTYVSGLGKDGNPCTVTQPCKTLQAALALTLAGGEIVALDSANYGYATINQAVSIVSEKAAGVLAASTAGITISAGANDIINLRGLDIDGAGSGATGIQFSSGQTLNVQNCVVRGFTTGINFQPTGSSTLLVGNTLISNNSTGINFLNAAAGSGVLNDVQVVNNGTGVVALGTSSTTPATLTVQNSVVAGNSTVGILSGGSSSVWVANSTAANNSVGVEAQNAGALLQVAGSTVTGNATGWLAANGGQVISSSTNSIGGNVSGNSAPPTAIAPPPATSFLLDSAGGYLLDSSGGKLTAS
jgi:hypothetical protein